MQSLIVLASLVYELAGGQNDPPPQSLTLQTHLSPLRVKAEKAENLSTWFFGSVEFNLVDRFLIYPMVHNLSPLAHNI